MKVEVYIRDINGVRNCNRFDSEDDFVEAMNDFEEYGYTVDDFEILMVVWGEHCIYSALTDKAIDIEDLIGFFA